MRFYIPSPPTGTGNTEEKLRQLTSWLFALAENLNVTLNCLGAENFNAEVAAKILEKSEGSEVNDIQN